MQSASAVLEGRAGRCSQHRARVAGAGRSTPRGPPARRELSGPRPARPRTAPTSLNMNSSEAGAQAVTPLPPATAAAAPSAATGAAAERRLSNTNGSSHAAQPTVMPAAAPAKGSYPWLQNYYPVAVVADLQDDKPEQVWLFGMDLVVWKSATGIACFQNACPHRMAPLSEGVVRGGNLECSYHGWQFNGEGRCVRIPQAEPGQRESAACSSQRACTRSFPVKVQAGLVWVWPDISPAGLAASKTAEPLVPPDVAAAVEGGEVVPGEGPRLLNTSGGWIVRDLPYSVDALLENVMDPAHVLFSHHGLIGKRENAIPFTMKLKGEVSLEAGLTLGCESHSSSLRNVQDRVLEFRPPCFTKNVMTLGGGLVTAVCGYPVPTRPGHSRFFSTAWTKDMGPVARALMHAIPAPLLHAYTNKVFDGDMVLVAVQEQKLAEAGGDWSRRFFMPTPSDLGVVTFRKWWDLAGGSAGIPWQRGSSGAATEQTAAAPGPADQRVLLDRLSQHTKQCASCRAALRRLERAEAGGTLAAVALALAAAGGVDPPVLAGAAGVAALVALASNKLKQELIFKPYVHH